MDNRASDNLRVKGADSLVSNATRRRIRKAVILAHIALLVVPLLVISIYRWLKPAPSSRIKIHLVTRPAPQSHAAPVVKKVKKSRVTRTKQIKRTQKTTHKRARSKAKFSRKKISKRRQPERSRRQTHRRRTSSRKQTKPKRKSRLLSAKDIIISRQVTTPKRKSRKLSAREIEQKLLQRISGRIRKSSVTAQSDAGGGYDAMVGAYIRPIWQQPARAALGGRRPEVTVRLLVNGNGRVIRKVIVKRSGVAAMDKSVARLLQRLQQVPPPPHGRSRQIEIILAVEP